MGKALQETFLNEDTQSANEHMTRYSLSLVIKKIQTQTTARVHFLVPRLARITKTDSNSVDKHVEKSDPSHPAGGNVKWCTHLENSLAVPQHIKQSNSTPRELPKRNESLRPHKRLSTDAHSRVIHNPTVHPSTSDKQINQVWCVHAVEYYSA